MTVFDANSQNVLGTWYAISEEYLAEITIDNDSIKTQMLDSIQSNFGRERGQVKHYGIYEIGDKKVVVVEDKANQEKLQYRAMTFFNIQGHSIELAANGLTKASKTIKELLNTIASDTTSLFGNVFYNKVRIEELEKLKDLETMLVEDFRVYLKRFINKREKFSFMEKLMPGTFRDQIVNKTLVELGYNPVRRRDWENRFFEKYLSDKEVGEIYREKF
jgi:hypothetical protein